MKFASQKHDLGFALLNQLSIAQKRFPRPEQDIAADYFAMRKVHTGTSWTFTEGRNSLNPASHCDNRLGRCPGHTCPSGTKI